MPVYTVICLSPDYATKDFGADLYVGTAHAVDGYKAAEQVQRRASEDNAGRLDATNF